MPVGSLPVFTRLPAWLGEGINGAIGKVIVEFAGLMALRDVEALGGQLGGPNAAALSGIISLDDNSNPFVMRLNFGAALWGLGGGGVHQSVVRTELVDGVIGAVQSSIDLDMITRWYSGTVGGDLVEQIDELVFSFGGDAQIPPSPGGELSMVVLGTRPEAGNGRAALRQGR